MHHPLRQRQAALLKVLATALVFLLGASSATYVTAAVDPYDQQSVAAGAELYDLYCSDCHGVDTSERNGELYDTVQMDVSEDYDELVELVRGVEEPEPYLVPDEEWPEWADTPAPQVERDVRADVLGTVTRAIDTFHGASQESYSSDDAGNAAGSGNAGGFDPVPGATNLANPTAYFYGISEEEMFNSIANGTGAAMPGWRTELGSDDAIWDLVNYIRSLWGEEWRY
jgi:mono/diheme cytochrome c family protein